MFVRLGREDLLPGGVEPLALATAIHDCECAGRRVPEHVPLRPNHYRLGERGTRSEQPEDDQLLTPAESRESIDPERRLLGEETLPEPSLLFSSVREGGESKRSDMAQAELGRLLAAAGGYRVFASDGTHPRLAR
jgi:hypothetical protein